MTWLTWRLQRSQVLVSVALAGILAAAAAYAWLDTPAFLALAERLSGCKGAVGLCLSGEALVERRYTIYILLMLCLPVLLGALAGAPLFARELEQGTYVFAVTQSAGRTRWWVTKLAIAGLPVILVVGALGIFAAEARMSFGFRSFSLMATPAYETHGPLILGLTTLAFCLSCSIGLLTRNTIATIAITIATYVAIFLLIGGLLRPHLLTPAFASEPVDPSQPVAVDVRPASVPDSAALIQNGFLDAQGNDITDTMLDCPSTAECPKIFARYSRYLPVERFWTLQWMESAIYCGIGLLVLLAGLGMLRRRLG